MFSGNVRTYKQRCNQERGYRPVPSANVVARMYRTVSSYSEWIDERRNVGRKDRIAIATRRFLALLSDESKRKFQSVRDGSIISPGLEPRAYRTLQEIEVVGGRSNDVRPEAEMIGREREREKEREKERERTRRRGGGEWQAERTLPMLHGPVQNGPLFVRCGCAIASGTRRNAKWNGGFPARPCAY